MHGKRKNSKCYPKDEQHENKNWPEPNRFKKNISLDGLKKELVDQKKSVCSYILTSVCLNKDNTFHQFGCAPNFQGECITLGTCKHYMRAWKSPEDWKGVWIAGFTHNGILSKKNYLLYLMKVEEAYISYSEVWENIGDNIRNVKNARHNPYGDIFEPKNNINPEKESKEGIESYKFYYEPMEGHKHNNAKCRTWKSDIYKKYPKLKNRPSILVGNPKASYYWEAPVINYIGKSPRTKEHTTVKDFLNLLEE